MSKTLVRPGLMVGETSYPLAVNLNALIDIEDAFDASFVAIFARFGTPSELHLKDFRTLLMAVICDSDGKRLDAGVAAEVIKLAEMGAVKAAVTEYMMAAAEAITGKPAATGAEAGEAGANGQ